MKPYQDINRRGNAYTIISRDYPTPEVEEGVSRLSSILQYGLLGAKISGGEFGKKINKKDHERLLAEEKRLNVFFNILGRLRGEEHYAKKLGRDYFFIAESAYNMGRKDNVGILFDLSQFQEGYGPFRRYKNGNYDLEEMLKPEEGIYRPQDDNGVNSRGEQLAYSEMGFVISPKVAPKHFTGILFKLSRRLTPEEHEKKYQDYIKQQRKGACPLSYELDINYYRKDESCWLVDDTDPTNLEARAKQIAEEQLRVNGNKPRLIVPIYDDQGNLWWPEKINYTELKDKK